MNADELIESFLSSNADMTAMTTYVGKVARSDALATLRSLQREIDTLNGEIAQLHNEKSNLQVEIKQLGAAKIDHLLVFLPVFFRNFWTVIRPDELAMMCGRLDVPEVKSPYLEPSSDTVRFMKNRFNALDVADQEQVLAFCRGLQHRLTVRTEMREFL
ncbi:MAG: hypothetical protein ACXWC0_14770 [Burkholderiales bacterium]